MLDDITPIIITYNESPNIGRTLQRLMWAQDIVVVDSYSNDDTLDIVAGFPQARVFQREFDGFANQLNFALSETGIGTEWVLRLDADWLVTSEMVEGMEDLRPTQDITGYSAKFVYCVYGRRLHGSALPDRVLLYRRKSASYRQEGHHETLVLDGNVRRLRSAVLHDDRKSLSRWLREQNRYARLSADALQRSPPDDLNWPDRLRRRRFVAPFVIFFYCLLVKGAILDGSAGLYYAFQRLLAELLLSLYLIEDDLTQKEQQGDDGITGSVKAYEQSRQSLCTCGDSDYQGSAHGGRIEIC
jgi:glycosyltransferase involved in cell wall biosynthesis